MAAIWTQQSGSLAGVTGYDGRRAYWLHDDMMISMRYARNLAAGDGLVWNAGQPPVEGYSNFLWVLVMAAVHLLPLPAIYVSLPLLLFNVALGLIILVMTQRLMRRLAPAAGVAIPFGLVALALAYDFGRWIVLGLETPLLTAVFLWLLLRLLAEADADRPRPTTFAAMGLLGLIRADGLLLVAILLAVSLALSPKRGRILRLAPLALLLPAAHLAFRLAYYGDWLPNTYYLKVVNRPLRLQAGLD
ncbi:MAG: hypothetical protein ACRDHL_04175, partial [Candidatus Promineifilaceae bacterium]